MKRLWGISINIFSEKRLLELGNNFEKIMRRLRVYFEEMVVRLWGQVWENFVQTWINFRDIQEKYWLNLENHGKIVRKSEDFLRKVKNDCENLQDFRELSGKFWRNSLIKKVQKMSKKFADPKNVENFE